MIGRNSFNGAFPLVRLSDVVEFLDSKRRPVTESDRNAGPYPYYGANGQQGTIDDFIFDEPLVLLAEDGGHFDDPNRGIAYLVSGKTWVNNHAHVLRPTSKIDLSFLCRVLENYDVRPFVTGTTRGKLTQAGAAEIIIPLPSLTEQRRIAETLDRAEGLRAKRCAALAQLDTLTQSIFLDMFGDPALNPKRVNVARLEDLCQRVTDGTHQPPEWAATGHPFLFVSNIISGEISFDTEKFISDETYASLTRRCPIEVGDVLYSTVGSYGVPALVRTHRKFAFQRHIAHIKPNSKYLNSEFLRAMLASQPLRRQADRAVRGMAQKTLNLSDLSQFMVFCPPLEVQADFAKKSAAIAEMKKGQESSLNDFGTLFTSIQSHAFRGDL